MRAALLLYAFVATAAANPKPTILDERGKPIESVFANRPVSPPLKVRVFAEGAWNCKSPAPHSKVSFAFPLSLLTQLESLLIASVNAQSPPGQNCWQQSCVCCHYTFDLLDCMPACGGTYRWYYTDQSAPSSAGWQRTGGVRCTNACWVCEEQGCSV